MLSDLNKDILHDMGIKTMGDIIAILRHSKSVTDKATRDKLLGPSDNEVGSTNNTSINSANTKTLKVTLPSLRQDIAPSSSQTPITNRLGTNNRAIKRTHPEITIKADPPAKIRLTTGLNDNLPVAKTVFQRLGNEAPVSETTSSIFARLGNNNKISIEPTSLPRMSLSRTITNKVSSAQTLTTGIALRLGNNITTRQTSKTVTALSVDPTSALVRKSLAETANNKTKVVVSPKRLAMNQRSK